MPITPDVGNPANGQTVGPTVTVLGSYSGTSDNSFTIKCTVENNLSSKYSKQVDASVDVTQKTWQATFSGLPASSKLDDDSLYTVTATVTVSGIQLDPPSPPPTRSPVRVGVMANPVVEVFVEDPPPIDIDSSSMSAARVAVDGPDIAVGGSYRPGYGWDDGYTVSAAATVGGFRISSHERLVSMADGRWECRLHLAAVRAGEEVSLQAELWRRNGDDWYPVVEVSRLLTGASVGGPP